MPIEYTIDHDRRLVRVKVCGTLADGEVFGYQREVWSRPEVAGYNELIDMNEAQRIEVPSPERVRELASLSASMDDRASASKLAVVAPGDLAFGLGRMYEAHRNLNVHSTKTVAIFRTMPEALTWLGTGL